MLRDRRFSSEEDYEILREILSENGKKTGKDYPQLHIGNLDFERFSFDESPMGVYETVTLLYQEQEKGKEEKPEKMEPIGFIDFRDNEFYITQRVGWETCLPEILDNVEKRLAEYTEISTDGNTENQALCKELIARGFEKTENTRYFGIASLGKISEAPALPEGYHIRKTVIEDIPRRVELYVLATGGVGTSEERYRRMMNGPAYGDALDLVVETSEKEIIAYCTLWADPSCGTGILEPLACVQEHRGKGIMKSLLLHGMNLFKERGIHTMYVGTGGKNAASQALYRSVGFQPYGVVQEWKKERK